MLPELFGRSRERDLPDLASVARVIRAGPHEVGVGGIGDCRVVRNGDVRRKNARHVDESAMGEEKAESQSGSPQRPPHRIEDRPGDAKDDVDGVLHRTITRRVAGSRRVDGGHGNFDDRDSPAKGGENDLGLEPEALVFRSDGERAFDRIATQAALRVAESPQRENRDEEIGHVVADEVGARSPRRGEVSRAEDERARVVGAEEDPRRLLRWVLPVGVDGDGDVASRVARRA